MTRIIGEYIAATDHMPEVISREFFGQGYIYKNPNAFYQGDGVCYIPELSDSKYTRSDFVDICKGNEDLAEDLFLHCDWQHPGTLYDELIRVEEWYECEKCGTAIGLYDELGERITKCPFCGKEIGEE